MRLVNVGALAGAKTKMVQADTILLERSTGVLGRRRPDRDCGATADAIIDGVGIDDRLQPKISPRSAQETAAACSRIRRVRSKFDAVRKICAMPLTSIDFPFVSENDIGYRACWQMVSMQKFDRT